MCSVLRWFGGNWRQSPGASWAFCEATVLQMIAARTRKKVGNMWKWPRNGCGMALNRRWEPFGCLNWMMSSALCIFSLMFSLGLNYLAYAAIVSVQVFLALLPRRSPLSTWESTWRRLSNEKYRHKKAYVLFLQWIQRMHMLIQQVQMASNCWMYWVLLISVHRHLGNVAISAAVLHFGIAGFPGSLFLNGGSRSTFQAEDNMFIKRCIIGQRAFRCDSDESISFHRMPGSWELAAVTAKPVVLSRGAVERWYKELQVIQASRSHWQSFEGVSI